MDISQQYDRIYRFCYFKVGNVETAEDITQETFLKYFETDSYLEKGKKLAFLYTIARNKCIDHHRRNVQTLPIEDAERTTADNIENTETVLSVRQAVSTLSPEEQELIMLRYSNELGIGEIALYLNISRFAVTRRLKAVKQRLKDRIRREDFYEQ